MKPTWTTIRVTHRQARQMAEAAWRMEQRLALYAEIGNIQIGTTVKDQLALAELRRRLYLAAGETPE